MNSTGKTTKIVFAHSAGPQYAEGKGSYDLVKYLRSALRNRFRILFPKIDKPGTPQYKKYKEMFEMTFAKIKEPVILIGHSLGGSTLLKYLSEEKPDLDIEAVFLVSTPHWTSAMKEFELKENFQATLENIPVFLYHSRQDEDASFESLAFYKQAFSNATIRELPGKQHTFTKGLPELVKDLKEFKNSLP